MMLLADILFAIAAVCLGQVFVLRRQKRTTVPILRFAPNYNALPGAIARMSLASDPPRTTSATAEVPASGATDVRDVVAPQIDSPARAASTTIEPAESAAARPQADLWPWERALVRDEIRDNEVLVHNRIRDVDGTDDVLSHPIDADDTQPTTPVIEPVPVIPFPEPAIIEPPEPTLEPAATHVDVAASEDSNPQVGVESTIGPTTFPWWRRLLGRGKSAPIMQALPQLIDEPIPAAALELEPEPVTSVAMASVEPKVLDLVAAPAEGFDDEIHLTDSFGLSAERRTELAAQAASAPAESLVTPPSPVPEPIVTPERDVAREEAPRVTAATAAQALAEAQRRASAWACEISRSERPLPVEKRRGLLEYYGSTIDDPASRAIVERVEREDPDLAARAAAILRDTAA
jgi:hypothetical protein